MAAYQSNQTRSEFTSLSKDMDFIDLAEYCEHLADEMLEVKSAQDRLAMCGRMAASLEMLRSALKEPVPEARILQLTVEDEEISGNYVFNADSETTWSYCYALTQVLLVASLEEDTAQSLTGLLFDLTSYQAEDLKAPRFVKNEKGLQFIGSNKVIAKPVI